MTRLIHRRAAIQFATASVVGLFVPGRADATGTSYYYDSLGRVVRVEFPNGSSVVYSYDDAGNRVVIARSGSTASPVWTRTIAITGTGSVNLYFLATTAGYVPLLANGLAQDAVVTFTLASSVTITGSPGGVSGDKGAAGIEIGAWPITQAYIQLALQISGTVRGGGGNGAEGDSGAGGDGGDAIDCSAPIAITINSTATVKAGGGGGGGGLRSSNGKFGGGGGGGGAATGLAGAGGEGDNANGHNGNSGTTTGGGSGGTGGGSGATAGGAGGSYATAGSNGVAGGGTGGAAGYAIRKNGFAVSVDNTHGGTITGSVG